ncbi:DUF1415 domain-containing protein [Legionella sp. PC997]|uniref:DUF1415 domain-containing protein n=1 Tax=Legionella sp. PC997 TaxID=2755562 RepID=UPI0015F8B588|nr:DUF1415 domain-containing protein [Legionella sp. PC997]QMT59756.1 hypothetical protein HBNCFIEN_01123 [Legionella sp. PC997]
MYISQTIKWIQSMVIGLNFCPFAKHEMDKNGVRIEVSSAKNFEEGLQDLFMEIELLNANPATGTTLLLYPHFLSEFLEYLDFVDLANEAIMQSGYQGVYQLATFHPAYQFYGTTQDDVSNYTNRSPYPMLHLLRETMLDQAIAFYGPTEAIPENNIANLRSLGLAKVKRLLTNCM